MVQFFVKLLKLMNYFKIILPLYLEIKNGKELLHFLRVSSIRLLYEYNYYLNY